MLNALSNDPKSTVTLLLAGIGGNLVADVVLRQCVDRFIKPIPSHHQPRTMPAFYQFCSENGLVGVARLLVPSFLSLSLSAWWWQLSLQQLGYAKPVRETFNYNKSRSDTKRRSILAKAGCWLSYCTVTFFAVGYTPAAVDYVVLGACQALMGARELALRDDVSVEEQEEEARQLQEQRRLGNLFTSETKAATAFAITSAFASTPFVQVLVSQATNSLAVEVAPRLVNTSLGDTTVMIVQMVGFLVGTNTWVKAIFSATGVDRSIRRLLGRDPEPPATATSSSSRTAIGNAFFFIRASARWVGVVVGVAGGISLVCGAADGTNEAENQQITLAMASIMTALCALKQVTEIQMDE